MQQISIKKWIPNALSLWRVVSAGKLALLLVLPHHELWLAQILIVIGVLTDKLDGTLARRWNVESELGKKIESIADPIFVGCSALYAYMVLDFPTVLFTPFVVAGVCITIMRAITRFVTGSLFYEKSEITRYATMTAMVTIVIYIFQIPYREWIVWPAFAYGMFAVLNYVRLMIQFSMSKRNTQQSAPNQ